LRSGIVLYEEGNFVAGLELRELDKPDYNKRTPQDLQTAGVTQYFTLIFAETLEMIGILR
jgi:hypothetical protein